jgi:hypothetical protein
LGPGNVFVVPVEVVLLPLPLEELDELKFPVELLDPEVVVELEEPEVLAELLVVERDGPGKVA